MAFMILLFLLILHIMIILDMLTFPITSMFWLRQSLKDTYPEIFKTLLVPKADELVATSYRFNGSTEKARDFFENGMFQAFKQINSFAREDIPVTIYYAFKQSDSDSDDHGEAKTASTGWEAMLSAIIQAGFSITGTWPMRVQRWQTERSLQAPML